MEKLFLKLIFSACVLHMIFNCVYFQAIRKSCDSVFNALIDILHERITRDIKREVSLCIGVFGYIISTDSSR